MWLGRGFVLFGVFGVGVATVTRSVIDCEAVSVMRLRYGLTFDVVQAEDVQRSFFGRYVPFSLRPRFFCCRWF